MGYPKCTQEVIEQATACKRNGMSNKDIIAFIGVHESTFYRWLNNPKTDNQRKLGESLKSAESSFKAALRSRIVKASEDPRHWQAAAWTLERMYPDEYGRPEARMRQEAETADVPTFVYERRADG